MDTDTAERLEFADESGAHRLWFQRHGEAVSVYVFNANELRGVLVKLAPEAVRDLREWLTPRIESVESFT